FPPTRRRSLAVRICKIDDVVRRAHQQGVIFRYEASDGVHVPDMILVRVDCTFSRHDMKRSDANIPKRFDRPAVVLIGPSEPLGEVKTDLVPLDERTDIDAASRSLFEFMNGLAQADARRRPDRGVLLANEFQRLRRPGHQFAIEAHPIGLELLPESGPIERTSDGSEQFAFERYILEEATSRARVANAVFGLED